MPRQPFFTGSSHVRIHCARARPRAGHPSAADPRPVIRSAADVSSLVNRGAAIGSDARIVVAIALGGVFLDAYDLGALAFGVKDIAREFSLTPTGTGFVASAITFGAIIGALLGGYLTDKIGRYRVFMADMFFFVVAAIACALAPNAWVLGGARFVMGLGVGIDLPVAMAFLAEFSRLQGRGNKAARIAMWCPTWYAAISVSYLLVLGLYAVLPESHSGWLWRLILGFGAVPAIVIIAIRSRYISESPVWAANQGDLPGAAAILKRSYGIDTRVDADGSAAKIAPRKAHGATTASCCAACTCGGRCSRRSSRSRRRLRITRSRSGCRSSFRASSSSRCSLRSSRRSRSTCVCVRRRVDRGAHGAEGRRVEADGARLRVSAGRARRARDRRTAGERRRGRHGDRVARRVPARAGLRAGVAQHDVRVAELSDSLRGVGVGFNQTLMRSSSTVSLFLFPVLSAALGTKVFWIIAVAPLAG